MAGQPSGLEKLEYLAQIDLLQELNSEDLKAIDEVAPILSYPPGTTIYEPGAELNRLFFLKRGRVRLFRLSPDGRQLTFAVLQDGNIFGETDSFATGAGSCYAETVAPTLVCAMTTADLTRFMERHPAVALKMIAILSRELRRIQELTATLVLENVRTRVLYVLVTLAEQFTAHDAEPPALIPVSLTHQDLAQMIGATRESVSQVLAELSREGVVRTGRGVITVCCERARALMADDPGGGA